MKPGPEGHEWGPAWRAFGGQQSSLPSLAGSPSVGLWCFYGQTPLDLVFTFAVIGYTLFHPLTLSSPGPQPKQSTGLLSLLSERNSNQTQPKQKFHSRLIVKHWTEPSVVLVPGPARKREEKREGGREGGRR